MNNHPLTFSPVIPDWHDVNYSDVNEVKGFAHLLMAHFQLSGAFDFVTPASSHELHSLIRAAKEWIKNAEQSFESMTPGDIISILPYYQNVYIPAYRTQPSASYIAEWCLKALDARIHGDRTVSSTELFNEIANGIRRGRKEYLDRPLKWYSITLDYWIKILKGGLEKIRIDKGIAIVTQLLGCNLTAFMSNQMRFKQSLVDHYLQFLGPLQQQDSVTLMAFLPFLSTIRHHYIDFNESIYQEDRIRTILSTHPDINRFHQEAFGVYNLLKLYNDYNTTTLHASV